LYDRVLEEIRRPQGADMTLHVPEDVPTWLVERSVVTIIGIAMPPRDPNDADDEDEEDEEDEDQNDGPAVIREPDDDE
jgi:hypothetical protein